MGTYQHQWLWDSCFHAIVWSYFNPEYSKKELLNLTKKQFNNGMLPHMYYWKKVSGLYPRIGDWLFKNLWPEKDRTHITQPPLIAQSVSVVYQKTQDLDFLEKIIGPVKNYFNWLHKERNLTGDGLVSIIHPWESGMDLLPVWDHIHNIKHIFTIRTGLWLNKIIKEYNKVEWDIEKIKKLNLFLVKDVAFNVVYILNLKILGELCNLLEQEEESNIYLSRAELAKESLIQKCWDEDTHFFYSIQSISDKILPEITVCGLYPLLLDIDRKKADFLLNDHLLNEEEFWLPFPIPSVAKSSPHFNPKGSSFLLWRGPTWFAPNWYIVKGLQKQGYTDIADQIIDKMCQLIEISGFREQYNPISGKAYGAKDFGWSTLIVDLI